MFRPAVAGPAAEHGCLRREAGGRGPQRASGSLRPGCRGPPASAPGCALRVNAASGASFHDVFRRFQLVCSRLLSPPLTWEVGVGRCSPGQPRRTAQSGGFRTALAKNRVVTGSPGPVVASRERPVPGGSLLPLPTPLPPARAAEGSPRWPRHQQRRGGMPGREGPSSGASVSSPLLSPASRGFWVCLSSLVRLAGGGSASSCTRL